MIDTLKEIFTIKNISLFIFITVVLALILNYLYDKIMYWLFNNLYSFLNDNSEDFKNTINHLPGSSKQVMSAIELDDFLKNHTPIHVIKNKSNYENIVEKIFISTAYICIDDIAIIPKTFNDSKQFMKILRKYITIHTNKSIAKNYLLNIFNYDSLYKIIYESGYFDGVIDNWIHYDNLHYLISQYNFIYYDKDSNILYTYFNMKNNIVGPSPYMMLYILCLLKLYKNELNNITQKTPESIDNSVKDEMYKFIQFAKEKYPDNEFWALSLETNEDNSKYILYSIKTDLSYQHKKIMNDKNIPYRSLWGDALICQSYINRSHESLKFSLEELKYFDIDIADPTMEYTISID